ncbi:TPA: hypothetical protein NHL12_001144 [Pseudomonas aeruginosa]|nr:hypothetical protein [Pseudomonas aeruginosa]
MSNELTDVCCPCGAEFQADSYDAGFIAGSGMCQNCDAALPPKDICTCPSGDGSLRHPCPAHPASVELAGVGAKLTFINGRPAMCGCQVEYSSGGGEYSDVIDVTLCAKHSGSAILDLVATNRIALTPEYEGQWHADLYLDREIPLAKAEGATPAEAVLALMSAERIDPEQESVEQAGGDERAAFEAAYPELVALVRWNEEKQEYNSGEKGLGWQLGLTATQWLDVWKKARAALAQPSPALPPFAEKVLDKLRRFYDCASDFESGGVDIGRHWLDLLTQLGLLNRVQRSPALWEISQQGEDLLGTPHPSPAQAEKAEAERPEVVAYADPIAFATFKRRGHEGGVVGREWMWAEPSAGLVAMSRSDECECIIGELRSERDAANARLHEVATACATAEQERDASLAEVERLRQFERICGGLPQDAIDGGWTVQGIRGYAKRLEDQLKVALDRVAELENQEPVAYVLFRDGEVYYETDDNIVISNTPGDETDLYRWLPVFTAPAAQAQQLHDLDKQCRDDVARALGLRPSQERGFAWSYLLASIKSCVKAAEDTAQAQHSVPDGYALVPLEPTDDMLVAGQEAWTHKMERRGALEDCEEAGDVYRAMLAAAPGKEGV